MTSLDPQATPGPGRPPLDRRELDPLLDAVLRCTALKGSRRATLREFAAEAGLSVGALQHHFGTRDALIRAAFERHLLKVTDRLERFRRSRGSASLRMGRFIDEIAFHHSWERATIWIDLAGRASDSEEYRGLLRQVNQAWHGVLVQLIAEGAESGEFALRCSAADAAWHIIGIADGLVITILSDGRTATVERGPWRRRQLAMAIESLLGVRV